MLLCIGKDQPYLRVRSAFLTFVDPEYSSGVNWLLSKSSLVKSFLFQLQCNENSFQSITEYIFPRVHDEYYCLLWFLAFRVQRANEIFVEVHGAVTTAPL